MEFCLWVFHSVMPWVGLLATIYLVIGSVISARLIISEIWTKRRLEAGGHPQDIDWTLALNVLMWLPSLIMFRCIESR